MAGVGFRPALGPGPSPARLAPVGRPRGRSRRLGRCRSGPNRRRRRGSPAVGCAHSDGAPPAGARGAVLQSSAPLLWGGWAQH
eukprot:7370407-Prymnesium_polylepis.1